MPYTYLPQEGIPDGMIDSCLASAAIPAFYPPILKDGYTFIDGGMIWSYNVPDAIRNCRNLGYDDSSIIVDTIILGVVHKLDTSDLDFHSLGHLLRSREISSFYSHMKGLELNQAMFPSVDFRYFIGPS